MEIAQYIENLANEIVSSYSEEIIVQYEFKRIPEVHLISVKPKHIFYSDKFQKFVISSVNEFFDLFGSFDLCFVTEDSLAKVIVPEKTWAGKKGVSRFQSYNINNWRTPLPASVQNFDINFHKVRCFTRDNQFIQEFNLTFDTSIISRRISAPFGVKRNESRPTMVIGSVSNYLKGIIFALELSEKSLFVNENVSFASFNTTPQETDYTIGRVA